MPDIGGKFGAAPLLAGLRSVNMGGGQRIDYLTYGAGRNNAEGDPTQPSLELKYPSVFTFRWVAKAGARTIQVNVKQACNLSPRPIVTVKANPDIGVNADVSGTAAAGTGWVTISVNVSPTSDGVVLVELESRTGAAIGGSCFFDHIVRT